MLFLSSENLHGCSPRLHGNRKPYQVLAMTIQNRRLRDVPSKRKAGSDIWVVGEACDGAEAIAQVDRLRPSVVVMDINMLQ
jgi:DNA-binding NarL/FixJ family response regulator